MLAQIPQLGQVLLDLIDADVALLQLYVHLGLDLPLAVLDGG